MKYPIPDENVSVTLFAKNLTEEVYQVDAASSRCRGGGDSLGLV
jgi:hypothetical protein